MRQKIAWNSLPQRKRARCDRLLPLLCLHFGNFEIDFTKQLQNYIALSSCYLSFNNLNECATFMRFSSTCIQFPFDSVFASEAFLHENGMLRAKTICLGNCMCAFPYSVFPLNPQRRVWPETAAHGQKNTTITPYRPFGRLRSLTEYKSCSRMRILSSSCGAATFNSD